MSAAAGDDGGGGLWASLSRLANALTNFFPIFVLGAAALGLARPSAYDFFSPAAITPSLAVTMLGMGLTLTFEVGALPKQLDERAVVLRNVQEVLTQALGINMPAVCAVNAAPHCCCTNTHPPYSGAA